MAILAPDTVPDLITNPVYHCCAGCGFFEFALPFPLQVCGQCRSVFYCSKECQKEHWAIHSMICTAPNDIPPIHLLPQLTGDSAVLLHAGPTGPPGSQHYSPTPTLDSVATIPKPELRIPSTPQQVSIPVTAESVIHPVTFEPGQSQSVSQGTTTTDSSRHSSCRRGQKQNRVSKKNTAPNPHLSVDEAFRAALAAFVFPSN
jgi:hypothetical protein